ncbi:unnamed protein product, partial [Meganyctiphanes norvegica]
FTEINHNSSEDELNGLKDKDYTKERFPNIEHSKIDTSSDLTEENTLQNESQNKVSFLLTKRSFGDINMKNKNEFILKRTKRSSVSSEDLSADPRSLNDAFTFLMTPFNNFRNYIRNQMEAIGLIAPAKKEESLEKTEIETENSDENEDNSNNENQDSENTVVENTVVENTVVENTVVDNTRKAETTLEPEVTNINGDKDDIPENDIKTENNSTNVNNKNSTNNNNGLELSPNTYKKYFINNISQVQKLDLTKANDNVVYYISTTPQLDNKNGVKQDMSTVATHINDMDNDSGSAPIVNISGPLPMEYTISSDNNANIKHITQSLMAETYDNQNNNNNKKNQLDSYPINEKVYENLSTFIPKIQGTTSKTKNSENQNDQDLFFSNNLHNIGLGVSPPPMKLITWIVPENAPKSYATEAPLLSRYRTQAPVHTSTRSSLFSNYISKRSKGTTAPLLIIKGPPDQRIYENGQTENVSQATYHTRNILNLDEESESLERAYGNENIVGDNIKKNYFEFISENTYSIQDIASKNKRHKENIILNTQYLEEDENNDEMENVKSETDLEFNKDTERTNNTTLNYENNGLHEEVTSTELNDSTLEDNLIFPKYSDYGNPDYQLLPTPMPLIAPQSYSNHEKNHLKTPETYFNQDDKQTYIEDNLLDYVSDSEIYNKGNMKTHSSFDQDNNQSFYDSSFPLKILGKPTYSYSVSYSTSTSSDSNTNASIIHPLSQYDSPDSSYVPDKETIYDDSNDDVAYTYSTSQDFYDEYTNYFENQENYNDSSLTSIPLSEISTDLYSHVDYEYSSDTEHYSDYYANAPLLESNSSESYSHIENDHLSNTEEFTSSFSPSSVTMADSHETSSENVLDEQHSEAVLSMVSFVHSFLCQESQDFMVCVNCLREKGISAPCS